jgi:hypothetical protein
MAGRPTLYKSEYNQQAHKLCLLGATDQEIADFFEVNVDTINEWKKKYPEFSVSISEGKKIADMEIAHNLYLGAKDRVVVEQQAFKVKTVKWNAKGQKLESEEIKIIELEKVIPADFRNQSFWLRNRKPETWREKIDAQLSGSLNLTWNEEKIYEAPELPIFPPDRYDKGNG